MSRLALTTTAVADLLDVYDSKSSLKLPSILGRRGHYAYKSVTGDGSAFLFGTTEYNYNSRVGYLRNTPTIITHAIATDPTRHRRNDQHHIKMYK